MDFALELKKAKQGKKEVDDQTYFSICFVTFLVVSCLASQNAFYGWEQGAAIVAMVLLAVLYFSGDWALALIVSVFAPKWAAIVLAGIVAVGLFLLSLFAGASFMVSQQSSNDVASSKVGALESELKVNQEKFSELGLTKTAERIRTIQSELAEEKKRTGADKSSSSAIYVYIAKFTGFTYELVSFVVRATWIFVFILTGMALSALRGVLWCPHLEKKTIKNIEKKAKLQKLVQQKQLAFSTSTEKVPVPPKKPLVKSTEIEEAVKMGAIAPTKSGIMSLGVGTNRALKELKKLDKKRVVEQVGNRHQKVTL